MSDDENKGNALMNVNLNFGLDKFAETFSNCVDVVRVPMMIKGIAKAETQAAIEAANRDFEVAKLEFTHQDKLHELKLRTQARIYKRELTHQKNIESIAEKVLSQITQTNSKDISAESVDPDWITRCIEECKDIGNEDLQTFWAKVIAGEIKQPGSFTLRTLATLKNMNMNDAKIFKGFSSCVFTIDGILAPIIYVPDNYKYFFPEGRATIIGKTRIEFTTLEHLDSIGLIRFDPNKPRLIQPANPPVTIHVQYFHKKFKVTIEPHEDLGNSILTQVGKELYQIVEPEFDNDYYEKIRRKFHGVEENTSTNE